jgi:glutamate-1-semialdehyde 2,1-aminomutase
MADSPLPNHGLDQALSAARQRFADANPTSRRYFDVAAGVLPGGNTRSVLYSEPFPLVIARGRGCRIWDLDGHEYVNWLGEFTAGIYGHTSSPIRRAIVEALDRGLNLSGHIPLEAQLAAAVCDRFPSIELVRFTNSGTEANLLALGLAKAVTKRSKILVFEGAYHGGVLNFVKRANPLNVPYDYVFGAYNDIDRTRGTIDEHASQLAAIIVEPMLGASGCIPARREFLAMLRSAATDAGCVLVFDEVMTSRLSPGGIQPLLDVHADLTTLGKYVGGGCTFGAFGGKAQIMSVLDPRRGDALPHAGTFNNNSLTLAAGLAGLTEVYTPAEAISLNERGDALRERLNVLCADAGVPLRFSGMGSLMNAHAIAEPVSTPADLDAAVPGLRDLLYFDLIDEGMYLARRGFIALSLPIGEREADGLLGAVGRFLDRHRDLLAGLAPFPSRSSR